MAESPPEEHKSKIARVSNELLLPLLWRRGLNWGATAAIPALGAKVGTTVFGATPIGALIALFDSCKDVWDDLADRSRSDWRGPIPNQYALAGEYGTFFNTRDHNKSSFNLTVFSKKVSYVINLLMAVVPIPGVDTSSKWWMDLRSTKSSCIEPLGQWLTQEYFQTANDGLQPIPGSFVSAWPWMQRRYLRVLFDAQGYLKSLDYLDPNTPTSPSGIKTAADPDRTRWVKVRQTSRPRPIPKSEWAALLPAKGQGPTGGPA